ncbi:MAG: hypothetical protein ACREV3_14295, partial [Gammaproteobacteria bacterium]
ATHQLGPRSGPPSQAVLQVSADGLVGYAANNAANPPYILSEAQEGLCVSWRHFVQHSRGEYLVKVR